MQLCQHACCLESTFAPLNKRVIRAGRNEKPKGNSSKNWACHLSVITEFTLYIFPVSSDSQFEWTLGLKAACLMPTAGLTPGEAKETVPSNNKLTTVVCSPDWPTHLKGWKVKRGDSFWGQMTQGRPQVISSMMETKFSCCFFSEALLVSLGGILACVWSWSHSSRQSSFVYCCFCSGGAGACPGHRWVKVANTQ